MVWDEQMVVGELLEPGKSGMYRMATADNGQMLSKRLYGGCSCLGMVVGWEIYVHKWSYSIRVGRTMRMVELVFCLHNGSVDS